MYKNTDEDAYKKAGSFDVDKKSMSFLYYLFRDYKIIVPFVLAIYVTLWLVYKTVSLIFKGVVLSTKWIWNNVGQNCMNGKSDRNSKASSSLQHEKKAISNSKITRNKNIVANHRTLDFTSHVPQKFTVKIDQFEDCLFGYLETLLKIPVEEIIKRVKTFYEIGKIIVTIESDFFVV